MAKSREPIKKVDGKEVILSSGVKINVTALAPKFLTRLQEDYPDPIPPKRTITVLGGTEEVDDLENPDYLEQKREVDTKRNTILLEAIIELCVSCDLTPHEGVIKRLEKFTSPFPVDPDERRIRFLYEYALKTQLDYINIQATAIEEISVSEEEVRERMNSFQSNMAWSTTNGSQTSSPNEVVGVAVEQSET